MSKPKPYASVIIPYGGSDLLRLGMVLDGLRLQDRLDFEVVLGLDAGKGEDVVVLEQLLGCCCRPNRIAALEPSADYRLSAARNKAVAHSIGTYLVFLDADCVPDRDFVATHLGDASRGILQGGYFRFIDASLPSRMPRPTDPAYSEYVGARASKDFRTGFQFPEDHVFFGNAGLFAEEFCASGGFDEGFVGHSSEDVELRQRLVYRGLQSRILASGKRGLVTHLGHLPRTQCRVPHAFLASRMADPSLVRNGGPLQRVWESS
jgi:glycosyltransferase involved in cell wall biosynthesis